MSGTSSKPHLSYAHIDYDRLIFTDANGKTVDLSKCPRVMCPRTRGGFSPGWIIYMYNINDIISCDVLLEEPSKVRNKVKSKHISKDLLYPEESFPWKSL